MPSSTSSSDPVAAPQGIVHREGALPAGLRLTASDRPGQAQPVPTRDVPAQPWGPILAGVLVALAVGAVGLELNARERIGLHPGDLDNSEISWSNEKLHAVGAPAAIVGTHWWMRDKTLEIAVERTPSWLVGGLLAIMAVAVLAEQGKGSAFIYFQF